MLLFWDYCMKNEQSDIISLNETGLFYKFALPNILSFILMSSAGIVDGIFIGRYAGELSLAAINMGAFHDGYGRRSCCNR